MKININADAGLKFYIFAVLRFINADLGKMKAVGIKAVSCRRVRFSVRINTKGGEHFVTVTVNGNPDDIILNEINSRINIIASI